MSNRLPLPEVKSSPEFLAAAEKRRKEVAAVLDELEEKGELDLLAGAAKDYRPNKYNGD